MTIFRTTSAPWCEESPLPSAYRATPPDPISPGEGWRLVGSAATGRRLFWFWEGVSACCPGSTSEDERDDALEKLGRAMLSRKEAHDRIAELEREKREQAPLKQRVADLTFALGDAAGWFDRYRVASAERYAANVQIYDLECDVLSAREMVDMLQSRLDKERTESGRIDMINAMDDLLTDRDAASAERDAIVDRICAAVMYEPKHHGWDTVLIGDAAVSSSHDGRVVVERIRDEIRKAAKP